MNISTNKVAATLLAALFLAAPAFITPASADEATDQKNKDWNVDVDALKKLAKKKKCKDVVMYREVLPYFGRENTIRASKEITVQFEKEDLSSGRAEVLTSESKCTNLLGNFYVLCTTDTALCYHETKKDAGKGTKLADIVKKKKKARGRKKK